MISKKKLKSFSIFVITTVYLLKIGIRNYLIFWCWPISDREFSHNDSFPRGRLAHYWRHWRVIVKEDSMDKPFLWLWIKMGHCQRFFWFYQLRRNLLSKVSVYHSKTGWRRENWKSLWGGHINGWMIKIFHKSHDIREEAVSRIHALHRIWWVFNE